MKQALPHAVPEALWGGPSGHMSVADTGRVTFARPCLTRGRFRIQIILLPKGRRRPHDHPASPHRPFVATAQLVRRGGEYAPSLVEGDKYRRPAYQSTLTLAGARPGPGRPACLPVRGGWEGTGAPEVARPQAGQTRPGGYGTTFEFTGTGRSRATIEKTAKNPT